MIPKALAHETRLLAVCFIAESEKTAQKMEEFLGTTQNKVSQHLARLKAAGILQSRKQGKRVFYSAASPEIFRLVSSQQQIYYPAPGASKGKERTSE